jgi:hypothetical protein
LTTVFPCSLRAAEIIYIYIYIYIWHEQNRG